MKEQMKVLMKQVRHLVLERMLESGYKEKLWMKRRLEPEYIESGLTFYPAKNNRQEMQEQLRNLFQKERLGENNLPFSVETKNRIVLEFEVEKYRVPFFIEVEPYREVELYPVEETLEGMKYYRFPTEEYLAHGFYEVFDKLELLNHLFWYKEIYDILLTETIDGRKVRDCLGKLLETKKIPSFEKRLDTIKSYEDYGYMKKKWKSEKKRQNQEFPEWKEVISLLVAFISPIFHAIIQDEIFFEDWMPQLGRYL